MGKVGLLEVQVLRPHVGPTKAAVCQESPGTGLGTSGLGKSLAYSTLRTLEALHRNQPP